MENKPNHIDDLFREQLGDIQKKPPQRVWEGIENQLNKEKRRRKVFFIQNIAATILVLITLGGIYFYSNKSTSIPIEIAEQNKQIESNKNINSNPDKNIPVSNIENNSEIETDLNQPLISPSNKKNKTSTYKNIQPSIEEPTILATNENSSLNKNEDEILPLKSKETTIALNSERSNKTTIFRSIKQPVSNEYLLALNVAQENETKPLKKKWSVGGQFSPTYTYRDVVNNQTHYYSDNSPADYNNTEKPIISYSGGINIKYETNSRITIQSGIHYSKMGQAINEIPVYNSYLSAHKSTPASSVNNSLGNITSYSSQYTFFGSYNETESEPVYLDHKSNVINSNQNETKFEQNLEYIEIPLVVKYKIIDKKIDFVILGGFSTNLLIGNHVYERDGKVKNKIGETENIRSINYSSIIGLGLDYNLASRLSLSIEPALKYHLTPANKSNETEFYPYSLGVYTGINYSF